MQTHKLAGNQSDAIDLYFYLGAIHVKKSKQVLLYDFNSIVAGVGGSLGLFLGFSCLGLSNRIIEKFDGK